MFLYIYLKHVQSISYIVYLLPLFLSSTVHLGQLCAPNASQCSPAFVHVPVRYAQAKEDELVGLIVG